MKTLMLLRHAKSSWDDEALPDHDRPLSKRGKKAAPRMGRILAEEKLVPDVIRSSTAVRARKTAEAVAKDGYRGDIERAEGLYLATAGKILGEAQAGTADSVGRLLLVGHNPGMEDLVSILVEGKEAFPTAALAVFEIEIDGWAELELGVKERLAHLWRPKELTERPSTRTPLVTHDRFRHRQIVANEDREITGPSGRDHPFEHLAQREPGRRETRQLAIDGALVRC